MSIHMTRWFDRWARRLHLPCTSLCQAVHEMKSGLVEADLGGGLYKKRVSRPGQGKRGGLRTLLASNRGDRWVFLFGFAKNTRDNIDAAEAAALHALAKELLQYSVEAITLAERAGELIKVNCNDQEATIRHPHRRP